MNEVQNNEQQKRKNRLIPLIWIGGAGLAGAIIILGIRCAKKQAEISILTKQLADTTAMFIREKEALDNELVQTKTLYNAMKSDHNRLNKNLAEQQKRNNRLIRENAGYALREKECKDDYLRLKGEAAQLRNQNMMLANEGARLLVQSHAQQAQLLYYDSLMAAQQALLGIQDDKLHSDSSYLARLMDSIRYENTSGYFNCTEFNGAYGLAKVDIPYSRYYYGLTTVNGYAVNRHLYAGLGLGLINYHSGLTAPLFLDFRYHFSKSGFSPYIYTDCGVIFRFKESNQNPILFFNPGIGFFKGFSDRFGLNLGAGILMQRDEMKSSFVNLKLGFVFLNNGGLKPWVYPR
jgi:hypothetical protein